eukprot:CAMPEP_0184491112 /NCGR_PEP_ID=MMETSP0113_2-20130426/19635_1 /TAXON_ID=91329 /ORGANISM="Norrisiella sphaerica, Strain BC52" /LENGTH=250 /DNA_ID=CAMNT_0026875329 /DNA_START=240 /DNA_END=992 /DNA_ORIENTATION=-
MSVFLNPTRLSNVQRGVEEQLNARILQYSTDLEGVVLSYSNLQLLSETGKIMHNFPHIECKALVRFLLYSPRKGSKIRAKVNKVGPDFLGLLALGIFNISVSREGLEGWKLKGDAWERVSTKTSDGKEGNENGSAVTSSSSYRLSVGSETDIVVKEVRTEDNQIFIIGSLTSSPVLKTPEKQKTGKKKKKTKITSTKKRKKIGNAGSSSSSGNTDGQAVTTPTSKEPKKKKQKKSTGKKKKKKDKVNSGR